MSWRFVLDSTQADVWHIDDMVKIVQATGYEFFTWNGRVYRLDGVSYKETALTVDDLH